MMGILKFHLFNPPVPHGFEQIVHWTVHALHEEQILKSKLASLFDDAQGFSDDIAFVLSIGDFMKHQVADGGVKAFVFKRQSGSKERIWSCQPADARGRAQCNTKAMLCPG